MARMRPVNQTLWDLIGDLEARDLKASRGKATRFSLTELSFKRLVAAGVKEVFRQRRVHRRTRRAGVSVCAIT